MNLLDKIKKGINKLPKVDQSVANGYISVRDFESLKEVVDSSIIKINKNLAKDNPKQEYLDIDTVELNVLQGNINDYIDQLDIPNAGYIDDDDDDESIYDDKDDYIEDESVNYPLHDTDLI